MNALLNICTFPCFVCASVQALVSDSVFGACLVYDLLALAAGQRGRWGAQLAWYAGSTAAVVGIKALQAFYGKPGSIRLGRESDLS